MLQIFLWKLQSIRLQLRLQQSTASSGDLEPVSYTHLIKLDHNQFISSNRNAAVEIRITMEAFGTEHKKQIIAALRDAGYEPNLIQAVL